MHQPGSKHEGTPAPITPSQRWNKSLNEIEAFFFFKLHHNLPPYKYLKNFVVFSPNHQQICVFRLCVPSKWMFPLCRQQQKHFLSGVQDLFLNQDMLHCRCCPLPTTHPKLKLATGISAWQRPLAVQYHMEIHDYIFHRSYVAQTQRLDFIALV